MYKIEIKEVEKIKTPLHKLHQEKGAKMTNFAGFQMPLKYSSIIEEHQAVRKKCGLFDTSHMGEFKIDGSDAKNFLQYLLTADVIGMEEGRVRYALLLNQDGGIIDDLLLYRLGENSFMLVVNASNIEKDFNWLIKHKTDFPEVQITNISSQTSLLALQGPHSEKVMSSLLDHNLKTLSYYRFLEMRTNKITILLSRTGYTGEDGFEIYCQKDHTAMLWKALMHNSEREVTPAGLGARDTLRLEMGYPLYGNELDENISPLSAGLERIISFDKGEFIGKAELKEKKMKGSYEVLVGFEMEEPGIPRKGNTVFKQYNETGRITSGTYSPTCQKGIALAYISKPCTKDKGGNYFINIRGKKKKAKLVSPPFVKKKNK